MYLLDRLQDLWIYNEVIIFLLDFWKKSQGLIRELRNIIAWTVLLKRLSRLAAGWSGKTLRSCKNFNKIILLASYYDLICRSLASSEAVPKEWAALLYFIVCIVNLFNLPASPASIPTTLRSYSDKRWYTSRNLWSTSEYI